MQTTKPQIRLCMRSGSLCLDQILGINEFNSDFVLLDEIILTWFRQIIVFQLLESYEQVQKPRSGFHIELFLFI